MGSHELLTEPATVFNDEKGEVGKLARDGVQVELQPAGIASCRQTFSIYLSQCLIRLQELATKAGLEIDWSTVVEMTPAEQQSMLPDSQQLGCQPSENIYGTRGVDVPPDWPVRSAGGHIHLGIGGRTGIASLVNKTFWTERPPERLIAVMDMLLGIPSVILDRSNQQLRRTAYGRAGEFRWQPHGIEYRTLSNFWIRDYQLQSLFTGLAKSAVQVQLGQVMTSYDMSTSKAFITEQADSMAPELLKLTNPTELQAVINESDLNGAVEIWKKVIAWADQLKFPNYSASNIYCVTLAPVNLKAVLTVGDIGIETIWPADQSITRWATRSGYGLGWEEFVNKQLSKLAKPRKEKAA